MSAIRRLRGFTLLEMLIGMTLVGFILTLLFAGLSLGTRSWEAGEERIVTSTRQAVAVDFIRHAIERAYPLRWRVDNEEQLAFAGEPESLRFVGAVAMREGTSVNHLIALDLEAGDGGRDLVMRWQLPDARAPGFDALQTASPKILVRSVKGMTFAYFGAHANTEAPAWHDRWIEQKTPPDLIRLQLVLENGEAWPDIVAAPRIRTE
jgi:general secretion pathway protein J